MIVCAKCSKENQDHYKFCLGCGAELSRDKARKAFSSDTPPHGVSAVDAAPAPAPSGESAEDVLAASSEMNKDAAPAPGLAETAEPPVVEVAAAPAATAAKVPGQCPQCGHLNQPAHRFCASCGFNLAALQAAQAAPAPAGAVAPQPVMLTALRADGSEAGSFPLPDDMRVVVGRDTGSIFAGDSYLSPKHACFIRGTDSLSVKDHNSLNGVYLKLQPNVPWKLEFGDIFRIGQEIVRFEAIDGQSTGEVKRLGSPKKGAIGRLALIIGRDTTGNAFCIPETGVHCGRERGDILFSEDGYVSGLHCRVAPDPEGTVCLMDVGSSNGTFVRLRREQPLDPGSILLMGQQLFRVDA